MGMHQLIGWRMWLLTHWPKQTDVNWQVLVNLQKWMGKKELRGGGKKNLPLACSCRVDIPLEMAESRGKISQKKSWKKNKKKEWQRKKSTTGIGAKPWDHARNCWQEQTKMIAEKTNVITVNIGLGQQSWELPHCDEEGSWIPPGKACGFLHKTGERNTKHLGKHRSAIGGWSLWRSWF